MKRRIATAVLGLMMVAGMAGAADYRLCTAALVTEGLCPDTSKQILSAVGLVADMEDLIEAMAWLAQWTAMITCNQSRIDLGDCTQGQEGDQVPNPQTEQEAALEFYVNILKDTVAEWRIVEAELTAAAGVDVNPDIE